MLVMALSKDRKPGVVYVDATIPNAQDPSLKNESYVAYVVVDHPELRRMKKVKAKETDEAEYHAILFAIEELKGKLDGFDVFCDNESVVSEVNRDRADDADLKPVLREIRSQLRAHPSIHVELFNKNPAHRYLNEELRKIGASIVES
jgi:ribonuclease HI